jgi:hypothetical protein
MTVTYLAHITAHTPLWRWKVTISPRKGRRCSDRIGRSARTNDLTCLGFQFLGELVEAFPSTISFEHPGKPTNAGSLGQQMDRRFHDVRRHGAFVVAWHGDKSSIARKSLPRHEGVGGVLGCVKSPL